MNPIFPALLILFGAAYLAVGVVVLRRPLIGRIARREALRRPGQTTVLVLGLMIAGAAIFSIQVIFDSMYETSRAQALETWGRDDIEISGGGSTFDPTLAPRLATTPQACSCIAATQNAIVTNGSVVDLDQEAGRPNVQITGLDLGTEDRFGTFVLDHGRATTGGELAGGGVFVTQPLASALGGRTGDRLRVIAAGAPSREVTIAGVIRREGAGAYGFDLSIFASLQTAQRLIGIDAVNLIRVSARGDGDAEITNGAAAASALPSLLAAQGVNLRVLEVKRAALDIVVKASQSGRPFVTAFGIIIALAATALVANLAIMLSEERRPRLAVLRALGLTRSGLVQLSVTEGAIYSLVGAIAALPAGIALGFIVVRGSNGFGAPGAPVYSVHLDSLLGSVAAASLINVVTVFLASLRTNGMTISSAIRDLPEPFASGHVSRKRLAFMALTALAGVIALLSGHPDLGLLGGGLIIAASAGLLKGRVSDRLRYSAAGLAATAWAFVDFRLINAEVNSVEPIFFSILISVVALSVLIAANLSVVDNFVGVLGRASARLRATLRPSMAYASRRPMRSGLVIAAFAIVMAILTLVQSLLSEVAHNYQVDSGGWGVQAVVAGTDQLSVPASLQSEIAEQAAFPSRTFFGPVNWTHNDFQGTTGWHQEAVTVFGLSRQQLESGLGFGHDRSLQDAIASNPSLVASTASIGSTVQLATDHGLVTFRVVATIPSTNGIGTSSIIPGLIASQGALDLLKDSAPGAMMLATPASGTTANALARDLQQALLSQGVDVSTTKSLLDQDYAASSGLPVFLILIMRIGLLVGVASLGAVALRAVIERRRPIGMLRAIGYQPARVLAGMLAETAAVATAGLAVGLIIAYALGGPMIALLAGPGNAFNPDPGTMMLTIILVYAAVLLVTVIPAWQAARLRPAEALRVLS